MLLTANNSEMVVAEKRRRLRRHYAECASITAEWEKRGYCYPAPRYPILPDDLKRLACGATTKAGTPCKMTSVYTCGRCKLHGGMSTGPKSEAGRRQSAENGKKGGRPKRRNLTP